MKKIDRETRPLAEYWMPPQELVEGGVGQSVALLATTYEFDASLLEDDLLPRFLGLKFDHTENTPTFRLELDQALRTTPVSVLVDASKFDIQQSTLSWDQFPIAVRAPGGIQHAKIVVLAWERIVRVILGSANLTKAGYRKNRELFTTLDFWDNPESTPLSLLTEVLNFVNLIPSSWGRGVPAAIERCADSVDLIRGIARRWKRPLEFAARERPHASFVATHPKLDGKAARSSLDEMIAIWGNRRAEHIVVVTPFVAPQNDRERDSVIEKLPIARKCEGWLVVPTDSAEDAKDRPCVKIPESFKVAWQNAFSSTRDVWVLPIPKQREHVDKDACRPLHAKAVLLEGDPDDLLMIGSSNFTPRGMGASKDSRRFNIEANLVFVHSESLGTEARLGLPVSWDDRRPFDEVRWQEPGEVPADEPPSNALPRFFKWASYSETTGELQVKLDRKESEPSQWSIALLSLSDGKELFRRDDTSETDCDDLKMIFAEDSRPVPLVALRVKWRTSAESEACSDKIAVSVQDKQKDLQPSPELRALSPDAILDCLISGLTPAEWFDRYDREQRRPKKAPGIDAASDSLRSVDTSGYLLYRIRRFGRALAGMAERIQGTALFPVGIKYRLFNDPFGPIPLAEKIVASASNDEAGWLRDMKLETRVFLVAEILLMVGELRRRMTPRRARRIEQDALRHFEEAIHELGQRLAFLMTDLPANNLQQYVLAIQQQAGIKTPHTELETPHAS